MDPLFLNAKDRSRAPNHSRFCGGGNITLDAEKESEGGGLERENKKGKGRRE